MMERMRDAFETATQGAMPLPSSMPRLIERRGESMTNPMAMVDSAMRQWQTAVQQMMDTPAAAMAVVIADEETAHALRAVTPRASRSAAAKRKSGARTR